MRARNHFSRDWRLRPHVWPLALFLIANAFSDVDDGANDQGALRRFNAVEIDLERDFLAVLMASQQVAGIHRTDGGITIEARSLILMLPPEAFRQKNLDHLTHQFLAAIAKQTVDGLIS